MDNTSIGQAAGKPARRHGLAGRLARALAYGAAFILPILLAGAVGCAMSLRISRAGAPPSRRAAAVPQAPPAYDPHKPTVAVVLGDLNDTNDVLGPYTLFAESAAYNVYTVAATRELRSLTDGLDIVPHYSFGELEARLGHGPDIVVVPAMPAILAPENQPVRSWIRTQASQAKLLFSWCTGAEVLAASGVLDGKAATAHWGDIDRLERAYPAVRWQRGVRYTEDGRIMTSAGLTSGIDATLHLLARLHGTALAERVARAIHYSSLDLVERPAMPQYRFGPADSIALLHAAFAWPKPQAGVWLYDGVGEIDLAAVFEVYGATWAYQVDTMAAGPAITSQHGLQLVPRWQAPQLPAVERLLLPGGAGVARVAAALNGERGPGSAPIVMLADPDAPRFAYESALEDIASQRGGALARFAAKRLEYRAGTLHLSGAGWPAGLLAMPLLIGGAGVAALGWLLRRGPKAARQGRRASFQANFG